MPPRSRTRNGSRSPAQSPGESPQRRSRNTRRPDLSGLDIDPEEDDDGEYDEDDVADVEEGDDTLGESNVGSRKRSRGAVKVEDDEDEDEEEVAEVEEQEQEEPEQEQEEDDEEEGGTVSEGTTKVVREGPKKRGRKRTKLTMGADGVLYDEEGNKHNKVVDDEVVIDDEDPKGLEKIDKEGNLLGERRFRNKTFTLLGQGNRKYMVSTEPARLVGFRDSYLLFKTHRNLYKRVCNNEEKMDLIERHIIPTSYKGRSVNLVTARSIYREFGAKILVDGKKIIDDFWEQRARDNGDVEGEYADPSELYNFNITRNGNGDLPTNANMNQPTAISGAALFSYETDPTWQYQIALQTREFNNKLVQDRGITFGGVKDVYTGLNFLPKGTQPSKCKVIKVEDGKNKTSSSINVDTIFKNNDLRKKYTGLSTLSNDIIDNIKDEEIKKAVLAQIEYEKDF